MASFVMVLILIVEEDSLILTFASYGRIKIEES